MFRCTKLIFLIFLSLICLNGEIFTKEQRIEILKMMVNILIANKYAQEAQSKAIELQNGAKIKLEELRKICESKVDMKFIQRNDGDIDCISKEAKPQ